MIICQDMLGTFYLSLIHVLSNLNFELLREVFLVTSFVSLAFAGERKMKKKITSLSHFTPLQQ
jgi:hypothetical protein